MYQSFGRLSWARTEPGGELSIAQTTNRFFDEIGRLMNDAAGATQGVKREVDTVMRSQAERILRDLDVVRRGIRGGGNVAPGT